MEYFLSCDWGTSAFRMRLVNRINGEVLMEEKSGAGIALTFNSWLESGKPEEDKAACYLNVVRAHIIKMEEKLSASLNGVKLFISGMASSTLGFADIPYNTVPFPVDGSSIKTLSITATKNFDHDVLIISGIKTVNDVMRGEETQLIGCIGPSDKIKNGLYILPGTHSKHIHVKNNSIVDFKTYMTGEVFDLLATKSILKSAVTGGAHKENNITMESFLKGVKEAVSSNVLHAIFKVRTNQLFNLMGQNENYSYLSGLMIGTELKDLKARRTGKINLVCGQNLEIYYRTALLEIGLSNINNFSPAWVDGATVRGHLQIGRQLKILA